MKNKIVLTAAIAVLILASFTAVASAQILTEGFETSVPPAGWTEVEVSYPGSGTHPDWSRVSSGSSPTCSPHEGSYMAKFNSYNCKADASARLYTSEMFFSGSSGVELKFWMYHDPGYSARDDRITVQGSTDGSTWTDLTTISRYDATADWQEHTVDLSAYDNQGSVWIGFLGISAWGNHMYIDEVEIGAPGPKTLSSLTVNQANTSYVHPGSTNNTILRLDFDVTGTTGTLMLNSIEVEPQNTHNDNVTWVKLYRTGTTDFSTDNPLGEAKNFSSPAVFENLNYDLPKGKTYVWVTYDIGSNAACGNTRSMQKYVPIR